MPVLSSEGSGQDAVNGDRGGGLGRPRSPSSTQLLATDLGEQVAAALGDAEVIHVEVREPADALADAMLSGVLGEELEVVAAADALIAPPAFSASGAVGGHRWHRAALAGDRPRDSAAVHPPTSVLMRCTERRAPVDDFHAVRDFETLLAGGAGNVGT